MATSSRKKLLLAGALAGLACLAPAASDRAVGQAPASAPAKALGTADFMRLAHSSAALQARAAELAASRDTRPEARAFAQKMVAFRREQIPKLEGAARANGLPISNILDFEHQAILENLQPLDQLELSRRYAEVQIQALQQELQIYDAGAGAPAEWVNLLVEELRLELRRMLEAAVRMREAVGP
jgi:predicted outer membrane protein